jgi:opacity protein-like surface antigen
MRRLIVATGVFVLAGLLAPATSYAQQSLNLSLGGFVPDKFDRRGHDDVLRNNTDFLAFNINDFNNVTVGAEYLVGLGDYLDAGLGVGLYQRTVPSVYWDFVNDDGSEIDQDLKLRMVPFSATVRVLPFGRNAVEPYVGAGVAIINWHYSESGEFVDFTDGSVFNDTFEGSGTAVGPTIFGGIRFPIGDRWSVGGEIRWQDAKGDLPSKLGFAGDKIDLGGYNYLATFKVKF